MKILIDDEIGWWAISERKISEQLANLKEGEEIEVVINSPGGSLYEGIAIFNALRKAAESHKVNVWINGLAASMASYITQAGRAWDKNFAITVNENSVYFIHNVWGYVVGNYKAMKKEADIFERLTKIIALLYSAVSGTAIDTIQTTMDDEAYYIGQEIIDAGFANKFESLYSGKDTEDKTERDTLIAQAQLKLETAKANTRKNYKPDEMIKVAALITDKTLIGEGRGAGSQDANPKETRTPLDSEQNKLPGETPPAGTKGGNMKPEELLAQHPDCYKSILALGENNALEKERKRVNAHLKMGKESGDLDLAAKFIQEGKSVQDDEVHADYMAAAMKNKNLQNRIADNPKAVNTEGQDKADEAEIMNSFNLGFNGKSLKEGD